MPIVASEDDQINNLELHKERNYNNINYTNTNSTILKYINVRSFKSGLWNNNIIIPITKYVVKVNWNYHDLLCDRYRFKAFTGIKE